MTPGSSTRGFITLESHLELPTLLLPGLLDLFMVIPVTLLTDILDLFTVVLITALLEAEEGILDAVAPGPLETMVHEGREDLEGLEAQSEDTASPSTADSSTIRPPPTFPNSTGRPGRSTGNRRPPFTSFPGAPSWRSSSYGPRGKRSRFPTTPC